ncbi:hypothetical protein ACGK9U_14665 [Mariniflexile sp. HNIBRBA6329]|uniref:hypothetical protein n=1 Tax=Mariniflexile sp. HNIBRBA6329 TaxID=3373088 RepID=UPI003745A338
MESNHPLDLGKQKVFYKKNYNSKTEKFNEDLIQKIYFDGLSDEKTGYYEYVPIKKNKKTIMKLIVVGKVKLYTRTKKIFSSTYNGFSNNPNMPNMPNRVVTTDTESEFFVIRDNEDYATGLIKSNALSKSFIYAAKKYFSDCANIIKYLNNDLYYEQNIIELIDDYNLLCE